MSMDNFGKPVSHARTAAGERALREMMPKADGGTRLDIIRVFVDKIERDEPAVLLCARPPDPIDRLDLTGRYRLLAHLMAEVEPEPPTKARNAVRGSEHPS
jgi:hypothetical protein